MHEMVNGLYWAKVGHFRPVFKRVMSLSKVISWGNCKSFVFPSFNGLIVLGSVLFLLGAMYSSYLYMFPAFHPVVQSDVNNKSISLISDVSGKPNILSNECNLFEGKWVPDESYPLYNASECPFAEQGFNCLANGRMDTGYLKWKWKPKDCDIPRFDANVVLEKLRGKRVVFVGDSLSRTQWESMICMLMTGVENKKSVYEVNGNKITKQIRHLCVRFSSFNLTVEFYQSVFLVQPGWAPKRAPKRVKSTLKLDILDDINREWIDSDILIFNSGHWWTPTKLFQIQGLLFPS